MEGCIVVVAVGNPVGAGTPPEAVDRHPGAADKLLGVEGMRPGAVDKLLGVEGMRPGVEDTHLGHNPEDSK